MNNLQDDKERIEKATNIYETIRACSGLELPTSELRIVMCVLSKINPPLEAIKTASGNKRLGKYINEFIEQNEHLTKMGFEEMPAYCHIGTPTQLLIFSIFFTISLLDEEEYKIFYNLI